MVSRPESDGQMLTCYTAQYQAARLCYKVNTFSQYPNVKLDSILNIHLSMSINTNSMKLHVLVYSKPFNEYPSKHMWSYSSTVQAPSKSDTCLQLTLVFTSSANSYTVNIWHVKLSSSQ